MRRLAAFAAQSGSGPLPALAAVSVLAYALLAALPQGGMVASLCGTIGIGAFWGYLRTLPWSLGFGPLVIDWVLMVVAMMTPLVSHQVARVAWSSRPQYKGVAVAGFLVGYWSIWCATIIVLMPAAAALSSVVGKGADLPVAIAIALIYSASPGAQRARNLCHRTAPVPAFGPGILTGSAGRGIAVGAGCIAVCWPWMLVPLTVQSGHLPVMILVGAYLFADRISPPAPTVWRVPPAFEVVFGPGRLRQLSFRRSGLRPDRASSARPKRGRIDERGTEDRDPLPAHRP